MPNEHLSNGRIVQVLTIAKNMFHAVLIVITFNSRDWASGRIVRNLTNIKRK